MRKRPTLNIPTGTIKGSKEEQDRKKETKEDKIAAYLDLLKTQKKVKEMPSGELK